MTDDEPCPKCGSSYCSHDECYTEAYDAAPAVPLSEARIAHMVKYATDDAYRDLYDRCRDAERALEASEAELSNLKHLGWLAYCGWKNRKSDCGARMTRLAAAVRPKAEKGATP